MVEERIRIWDVATHQSVATWPSESWHGTVLTYSPDGTRLAFGGMEGIVEIWDTATGRKVRTLKGHAGVIWALAFSPDGQRLATGGADGKMRLWEIAEPGGAAPIARPDSGTGYADLSPDGRSLLVVGSPGWLKHIELWDTATRRMRGGPIDLPLSLEGHAWSAEGARLYLADEGKTVRVIETASGHVLRNLQIDAEPSWDAIALSPDERWLAYSVPGGTIRVRDARTGVESRTIRGLADEVHGLRFSPDGARLLGADASGGLKIWDPATGREVAATTLSGMYIEKIRFSRDGNARGHRGESPRIGDRRGAHPRRRQRPRDLVAPGPQPRRGVRGFQPRRAAPGHRRRGPDGPDLGPRHGAGDPEAERRTDGHDGPVRRGRPPTDQRFDGPDDPVLGRHAAAGVAGGMCSFSVCP